MVINQIFELSMLLDSDHFQKIIDRASAKSDYLEEHGEGYIDMSMAEKGIEVIYRASQYKKKVRLIVNTSLLLGNGSVDGERVIRKLDKRIGEYFGYKYRLDNFSLSGMGLIVDIDVGSRENVSAYLKVMKRVGKVKGFSPSSYDGFNGSANFCLSGNSNGIDFLLYDLEGAVKDRLTDAEVGRKKLKSASEQTKGILRVEIRLTKPKAIWAYTDADDMPSQIKELTESRATIFMDTFARVVLFGNFYKKDAAMEIIRKEVKDNTMRRKMLRLLVLIPEKKSLHLAQKTAGFRDVEKVMEAFAKINLSPVTLSKRHDVKCLGNLYSYMLDSAK